MKRYPLFLLLYLTLFNNCSKDIDPPFNPFLGTWKDFQTVYYFDSEPRTITYDIEIDYSRSFNINIENDNGDIHYPCNIDLIPIRFTEYKFIRTNNHLINNDCVIKYMFESAYDFIKKNDSLYTIHFYEERHFNNEENFDEKYDPPALVQITDVHVERNILTFVLEPPEEFQINGRKPVINHYQIKRN